MNNAHKGRRAEYKSIRLLEASGYRCVRAAGSKGAFDIVAVGSKDIILLQVKSRDWPSSSELEAIRAFVAPSNCRRIIHRWVDRKALPDVREIE